MRKPDALIVGAGAIGAASAYFLARTGRKVVVIDSAGIAAGATGAAEGIVGSVAKRKSGPVTDIVVKSFAMFPTLGEELGSAIEFTRKPGLMAVDDESHVDLLKRFVDKRRREGLQIEWLDEKSTREAEPLLGDNILGAVYTPAQGLVNPIRLAHGFLAAARRLGAEILVPARLTGFEESNGRVGTALTSAGPIAPALVVNAAGAQSGAVAAMLGASLEITPKRAQMLVSEALPTGALRNTIYCAVNVVAGLDPVTLEFEDMPADPERRAAELANPWQLSSFTQTAAGNILFCGGFGFVGATREVDARTILTIAENVGRVMPALRQLRIIRAWAGMEPCTPTNIPAIGQSAEAENFYHAAGHGNAGVMMSPYTGRLLAERVDAGAPTDLSRPAGSQRATIEMVLA